MEHSIDFFRDEVRNGFYIPTAIKQAWAACLDVLGEIDRICEKHGIKYFADWGTILGAVRHGGFVPWDDDLDICMLRNDYTRFREVADRELPEEFVIHDYERKQDHWLFLARVVNNSKMCFDKDYLIKHNNFPWLAGVDIFVKDYLYTDDEEETQRDKEVMKILALADGIVNGTINRQSVLENIDEIEKRYSVKLTEKGSDRGIAVALYRLAEQQMARVRPEETDRVGQIFPWILKRGPRVAERKERYKRLIRLPFEDTTIPVPAEYNSVLASRYGNYCIIRKVWGGHDYPYFEKQKEDIEQISGKKFSLFGFDWAMLKRSSPDKNSSLKTISGECLSELKALLDDAEKAIVQGLSDEFAQFISDSQQLAADFGTLVEKVKGEDRDCTKIVIEALQDYCDALWLEYQGCESSLLSRSRMALEMVSESVKQNVKNRREVLFLPTGPKEWKEMKPFYDRITDNLTDVYVVLLPLMRKTLAGEVTMTDEEIQGAVHIEEYPQGIEYTDWMAYDPSLHCPDEVYVQNPYDGANPLLTVPSDFYAGNLRRYSEKITYVPAFRTGEFGPGDITDQYNLRHYVTAPGIIYSDEIIVWSENIREQYINVLTTFAGEETRSIWQDRIKSENYAEVEASTLRTGRKMLYCIGANELTEHPGILLDAVSTRLNIFKDAQASIKVTIALYPGDRRDWESVDKELSGKLFSMIERGARLGDYDMLTFTPQDVDDVAAVFDAYYGSPSPLVPAFTTRAKPVMLADYSINKK